MFDSTFSTVGSTTAFFSSSRRFFSSSAFFCSSGVIGTGREFFLPLPVGASTFCGFDCARTAEQENAKTTARVAETKREAWRSDIFILFGRPGTLDTNCRPLVGQNQEKVGIRKKAGEKNSRPFVLCIINLNFASVSGFRMRP